MKAYIYDVFHRCESITDWTPTACTLALDSTQKVEGKYSIKLTSNDDTPSYMRYDRTVDWSEFGHIIFSVYHPGWTDEVGRIGLYTDMLNYKVWTFNFAASWTEIDIDLSSVPDSSLGTLDLSNITFIIVREAEYEDPGEDYYFDFFRSRSIDVSDYIENIRIKGGIFPIRKVGSFITHPDHENYFTKKHNLEILDDSDNTMFLGVITDKNRGIDGLYRYVMGSYFNEAHALNYVKAFSSDKSSEKIQDVIDNSFNFIYRDASIVATTLDYDYSLNRQSAALLNLIRFLEREVISIAPGGLMTTEAYNGLTATGKSWDINDNSQIVMLINAKDILSGYYKGSSDITRASVRMDGNVIRVKPDDRADEEQARGVIPLKEYRDIKLVANAPADQLATNLFEIFSLETEFIALRIEGEGFLSPGQTIEIENTGSIPISQKDFCIISFIYDPKSDIYLEMIVSNNIVLPSEFTSNFDTSALQIHQANLQTFENATDVATKLTTSQTNKVGVAATDVSEGASEDKISDTDLGKNGGIYMPLNDNNALGIWTFHRIPDYASGTFTLKVEYWCDQASKTYSGLWSVTAQKVGDSISATPNILNGSNAYDLSNVNANEIYLKTIPIAGTVVGDTVNVCFKSDALNARFVVIRAIWIEWS